MSPRYSPFKVNGGSVEFGDNFPPPRPGLYIYRGGRWIPAPADAPQGAKAQHLAVQAASKPKPLPTPAAKPVAPKRQSTAMERQLAEQTETRKRLEKELAFREQMAPLLAEQRQLQAELDRREKKAGRGKGFAGRIRFASGFKLGGKHEQRRASA